MILQYLASFNKLENISYVHHVRLHYRGAKAKIVVDWGNISKHLHLKMDSIPKLLTMSVFPLACDDWTSNIA